MGGVVAFAVVVYGLVWLIMHHHWIWLTICLALLILFAWAYDNSLDQGAKKEWWE